METIHKFSTGIDNWLEFEIGLEDNYVVIRSEVGKVALPKECVEDLIEGLEAVKARIKERSIFSSTGRPASTKDGSRTEGEAEEKGEAEGEEEREEEEEENKGAEEEYSEEEEELEPGFGIEPDSDMDGAREPRPSGT